MEFRLAQKSDLKPEICQAILDDAVEYCKENPRDSVTPWDILNIFINYCEGKITAPHFWMIWLGFKDKVLVGYVITESRIKGNLNYLNIAMGFISKKFRGNGIASHCLGIIENQAKKAGYSVISCETFIDPKIYSRWMRKYGYKANLTEFRKEI